MVEKRCNVQCVVVYRDDVNHHLYVHDVHRPDQSQYTLQVIKYTKEICIYMGSYYSFNIYVNMFIILRLFQYIGGIKSYT